MKKAMRRTKYLLLLLIVFISIGYAILQSNLNIIGTTGINNPTWDIHWNNVQVTTGSVTGANVTTPATIDTALTTVNYNIKLSKPGDFYEFTVDAVNAGTIDGMIETISSKLNGSEITTLPNYLNYGVTYSDDTELQINQELKSGTTETYKVRIEYKKDIAVSDLPGTEQTLNLSFTVTYKQADEDAQPVVNPISFSTDSWSTIVSAVKRGKTENYNVGDTKEVDIGSLGTHTLRIANMSTPSECSTEGFSQTACGFVIEFADIITTHYMNPSGTYQGEQYSYGWNIGGWPASELRSYINQNLYELLPPDMKNSIKDTFVVSGHGLTDSTNYTSVDKLYLFSRKEVTAQEARASESDYTRQLDYYSNNGVSEPISGGSCTNCNISLKKDSTGTIDNWWLRSAYIYTNNQWFMIASANGSIDSYANISRGVSPAFRIG